MWWLMFKVKPVVSYVSYNPIGADHQFVINLIIPVSAVMHAEQYY